jgi:rubrerythrin
LSRVASKEAIMNKTKENLEFAFAGESQANRKYLFFAEKAEEEGQKRTARLFRAAADAETVHARNHLRVMQNIKSTKENLQAAIDGENHEFTEMYPQFIKSANTEGEKKAADSFDLANKVEKIHHGLYRDALAKLERGDAIELRPFYVCQYCGNTVEGEAPRKCPVCGAPKKTFKLIE